ncbi:ABC transporter ATP-binding protein [Martelella mediterranea]|uniref:Peptide/nickel transport system ATP-binding protein n=1 Tax=Martelella mediterranea TaxID=293089 RepID=A0A4R3NNU7_9HYPH|nr:ABC transporter ATP-binding protein [Martelella mediterranea]TCT37476.1 peptide/nickel transport system ATP-binding protein [Martelella mediterranea]
MAEPLLEIDDLKIEATSYPPGEKPQKITIVDGVSLKLEEGKVLGLIGESGAGKSTIGLSAMGYGRGGVRLTGGSIKLNGREMRRAPGKVLRSARGAEVTYVAQSAAAAFNPARKLMDQVIESTVKHKRMSRTQAKERAVELFTRLGLPDPETFGDRYPHQVSGGQLQRAMTAMALCPKPDLVVFDEPTTALDVTTQLGVLAAIKKAIRDFGVAALYITHDLAVVAQIADDIMVLRCGETVEYGTCDQIINDPQEDYTRDLVSAINVERRERDPDGAPVLTIRNISARYSGLDFDVLKDINMEVQPGTTLAIVGESGSGKSTLARVLTGLLQPHTGAVEFDGSILSSALKGRSKQDLQELQMIYQMADVAMNPRQTVGTIIGRPLEFYFGMKGKEQRQRVIQLLDRIELGEEFVDRYPAELSGGQKQRVCIARALAAEPKLIICDEVTSALDPLVAKGILKLLRDLQLKDGVTYIFITHDIAAVREVADTIAVMYQGEVVRYGGKQEVLSPPFDDYTKLLMRSVPEMRIGWLEDTLEALDEHLPT